MIEIYLAKTQGFCAGVSFAVNIVDNALEKYGAPLYVYHEIVHNTYVVESFKERGVTFVENIEDVPEHQKIIFSAHGVPPSVIKRAQQRHLIMIDATCPLVTKVHHEAIQFSEKDYHVILIGHKGHQELTGTAGYVKPELLHIIENEQDVQTLNIPADAQIGYITQTTLSVDDAKQIIKKLHERFPNIIAPKKSDVCYATQNRQDAVKDLAKICDVIIICGSSNSSNSNRLRETGEKQGVESYIIDSADELDLNILKGKKKIGISSGASVPRIIVDELVTRIEHELGVLGVHTFENPEKDIVFKLPKI